MRAVEHNIKPTAPTHRHRVDMSSFFNQLAQVSTAHTQNTHAEPTPGDMAALYELYTSSLVAAETTTPLSETMRGIVAALAQEPPRKVRGVPQEFIDGLERVDRKKLGADETCAICAEIFVEDQWCLVVELPCQGRRRFDLDCIAPWLLLEGSCPMDRQELGKKKEVVVAKVGI